MGSTYIAREVRVRCDVAVGLMWDWLPYLASVYVAIVGAHCHSCEPTWYAACNTAWPCTWPPTPCSCCCACCRVNVQHPAQPAAPNQHPGCPWAAVLAAVQLLDGGCPCTANQGCLQRLSPREIRQDVLDKVIAERFHCKQQLLQGPAWACAAVFRYEGVDISPQSGRCCRQLIYAFATYAVFNAAWSAVSRHQELYTPAPSACCCQCCCTSTAAAG